MGAGRWWIGALMAGFLWHSGAFILLFSLLLCQWCCSHRRHVYSIFVSVNCPWDTAFIWSFGPCFPLQPHGWSDPLWNWFSSCLLWCKLCPSVHMVGLWIYLQCGQYYHLAWCWWHLVEIFGSMVKPPSGSKTDCSFASVLKWVYYRRLCNSQFVRSLSPFLRVIVFGNCPMNLRKPEILSLPCCKAFSHLN